MSNKSKPTSAYDLIRQASEGIPAYVAMGPTRAATQNGVLAAVSSHRHRTAIRE